MVEDDTEEYDDCIPYSEDEGAVTATEQDYRGDNSNGKEEKYDTSSNDNQLESGAIQ